jgi:tetratricopeptide (TPR) repeat protein
VEKTSKNSTLLDNTSMNFCPNCGFKAEKTANFCRKCGHNLIEEDSGEIQTDERSQTQKYVEDSNEISEGSWEHNCEQRDSDWLHNFMEKYEEVIQLNSEMQDLAKMIPLTPQESKNKISGGLGEQFKGLQNRFSSIEKSLTVGTKPKSSDLSKMGRYLESACVYFGVACVAYRKWVEKPSSSIEAYTNERLKKASKSMDKVNEQVALLSNHSVVISNQCIQTDDTQHHNDDPDILNNRGDELYELGRYEEALSAYNHSLELKPDDSDVLASRGDVLYELERFDEALRDYDRSLEISSDDTLTLEGRGDTLYELGRYEEALDVYNRLLELEPDNSEVLKSREVVLQKLKRPKPIADTKSHESTYDKEAKNLRTAINKSQVSPTDKAVMNIQTIIFTSALSCSESIIDKWTDFVSRRPSMQIDFGIRTEMLFFFIHMTCTYAFAEDGPQFRDKLQDRIVESLVRDLIRSSFHKPSGERPSFTPGSWSARGVDEVLERYNEAEFDYEDCEIVGRRDDFLNEETVLGKLAQRINRDYAGEKCLPLRHHICAVTAEALDKSEIKEQLEEIHRRELI